VVVFVPYPFPPPPVSFSLFSCLFPLVFFLSPLVLLALSQEKSQNKIPPPFFYLFFFLQRIATMYQEEAVSLITLFERSWFISARDRNPHILEDFESMGQFFILLLEYLEPLGSLHPNDDDVASLRSILDDCVLSFPHYSLNTSHERPRSMVGFFPFLF